MAVNLIKNGDFEATRVNKTSAGPNFNTNTGEGYIIDHTPQNWSLVYGSGVDLLNDIHGKFGANKTPYGQYVELDGRMNTGITQTVSTSTGKTYRLSFDWALPSYVENLSKYKFPDYSSKFDVVADGRVVFSYDGTYGVRNAWTHQDIFITAGSGSTIIQFLEKGTSDAEGTLLDNISLVEAPIIRGNSLYTIVDGPSWTQAEANSVKLGGHLVALSSKQEESFVVNYAESVNASTAWWWMGLGYNPATKEFRWSNGENTNYNNWYEGGGLKYPDVALAEGIYGYTEFTADPGRNWAGATANQGQWAVALPSSERQGIAETPFIRRGDSAYVIVQGPTWEEAEANAVKLGGHLVTINDAEENQWILETLRKDFANGAGFIGYSDTAKEGTWIWSSGESASYSNWDKNNPSNSGGVENVGTIQFGDGSWNDIATNYWNWFGKQGDIKAIAEIKLAPNNNPTGTPALSGTLKAGQVITIDRTPIQDADNFSGYSPDFKYSWEISSNGTTWTPLTTTDATDNNSTYTLTTAEVGKQVRGVVSYLDGYGTQESVASTGSSVTSATVVRGNSLYTIVDGPSWTQAEANSVKLGGHLATINNENENRFIYSSNTLYPNVFRWIGINDIEREGVYKWASGEISDYREWVSGVEDGDPGLTFYGPDCDYGFLYDNRPVDAWWNIDLNRIYSTNSGYLDVKGIAETPFIRRGDSAYVIVQGPTWEEAEANAVKLGGHLVTINDAEENEWIVSNYGKEYLTTPWWIGYSDEDLNGAWEWSDRSKMTYENWALGEPNTKGDYGPNYAQIYINTNTGAIPGLWNDAPNWNGWNPNGYPTLGIAEIKLAPNNTPTGTPALSGTLKAGQVITIDRNPIQDADNFTGYTPDFKYSWEIAKDPGMTMMMPVWESLNTADATDGDETFTITADLTGKLIRGVVSYLDGYGTQESVASTASAPITSSAPPIQSLTLTAPSKSAIRSGTNSTSAISYTVSTGEKNLTGVGASLYFDSTQLTVSTAGEPFQKGLIGNAIVADTNNADGDPKTDKVLALTYADFGGNFPGSGTTLPLTLANLNLVPTSSYSGTTLHLKGSPATGFTATGADLTLGYNASPVVNSTLPALTTNRGSAFTYTFRSDLFTDADSTLTLSATTSTGTALPSWLSFNPATRTLSGTPTTGGTLNLNLSASDELGSVSTPLSIKVREVQQLSSSASSIRYQRNKDFTLPINYSTTDGSSSTGLAFKVHFNSSLFSFDPNNGVSNKLASAGLFEVGAVQQDTGNSDNDPTTDQYIPISIASFTGQLPSGSKLADLTFRTADKAIDPLTGLKDTSINFTETSVASGYGFSGTSASLKPLSFNLDVDGDGLVTPLGDGLMVIRYLFGNAFAGDALINKAISPDSPLLGGKSYSTMTATEKAGVASLVATNIQQGIDSKLLDVDGDGKTTPLGDGLMVIRRLFGNAFAGSALTSKAISPESPYFSDPNAHLIVASNIDALKPTPTVI